MLVFFYINVLRSELRHERWLHIITEHPEKEIQLPIRISKCEKTIAPNK